jgi:hypothetical protein
MAGIHCMMVVASKLLPFTLSTARFTLENKPRTINLCQYGKTRKK